MRKSFRNSPGRRDSAAASVREKKSVKNSEHHSFVMCGTQPQVRKHQVNVFDKPVNYQVKLITALTYAKRALYPLCVDVYFSAIDKLNEIC